MPEPRRIPLRPGPTARPTAAVPPARRSPPLTAEDRVERLAAEAAHLTPETDTLRTLRELSFLHEFAQLATQARDWDELMQTVVDRTREALHVEVCSFYLLDHGTDRLTLAATNGLDQEHVGQGQPRASARGSPGPPPPRAGPSRSPTCGSTRASSTCAASTWPGSPRCSRCRSPGTTWSSASSTSRRSRRAGSPRARSRSW